MNIEIDKLPSQILYSGYWAHKLDEFKVVSEHGNELLHDCRLDVSGPWLDSCSCVLPKGLVTFSGRGWMDGGVRPAGTTEFDRLGRNRRILLNMR